MIIYASKYGIHMIWKNKTNGACVYIYMCVHISVHEKHVSDPELGHLIQFMLLWIFWEASPQLRRLGSPFQIEWKTRIETICAMLSL